MGKIWNKFKAASPEAKASMAFLFANLVLKGLSLISGPVFTRLMSTEQYGMVSTFLSWQSLLSVIITLNLAQGVFNNGMLDFREDRDTFEFSLLAISTVTALVFLGVFWAFKSYFLALFEMPEILVYILIAYLMLVPAYSYWSGRQRYEFKYLTLCCITIGIAVFSLIFGVIAVLISPDESDAVAKLAVTEGITILVGGFFCVYLAVKSRFRVKAEYCKYALRYNLPLVPHYMSMYVLSSSDRIMITKMISKSATAYYSVSYTVASVISIVWQSLEAALSPWIYQRLDRQEKEPVKKLTVQVMTLFAVICVACTLFAPEIMRILAPKSYYEGVYVIPAVAAGVFFTAMYTLYMRIELFYKQTGFASVASMIAAISNVALNFIFIRLYGFVAAGYTTMVCYALLSFFHYLNVKRKGYADILDNRMFLLLSVAVIGVSVVVSVLYSHTLIRYGFVIVVFAVLYTQRKLLIQLLKRKL